MAHSAALSLAAKRKSDDLFFTVGAQPQSNQSWPSERAGTGLASKYDTVTRSSSRVRRA